MLSNELHSGTPLTSYIFLKHALGCKVYLKSKDKDDPISTSSLTLKIDN